MSDKDAEIAALKAELATQKDPQVAQASSEVEKPTSGPQKAVIGCLTIVGLLILVLFAPASTKARMAYTGEYMAGFFDQLTADFSKHFVTPAAVPSAIPTPTHRWNYQDGSEYGYQGELSDDDRKAGKAAADVHMYRYLGEKGGIYTVESADDGETIRASCANPCEVVKVRTIMPYGSSVQHIAFNPDSIVGAALSDAFDGQLQVHHPAPRADGDGQ